MGYESEGRAAIITGGGTWIGTAIAEALTQTGLSVMVVGRRKALIENVAHRLADKGCCIEALEADIREKRDRRNIIETCIERFGRIDVLVNNAAVTHIAPLLDYSESDWENVMQTNVEAAFFLAQSAAADMRMRRWGRIVNIASVYGSLSLNNEFYPLSMPAESPGGRGPYRACAYHASKGALLSLTRELAVAVAPWGITVNAVSPGMIPPLTLDEGLACDIEGLKRMTPMGRMGRPEEIAHAVQYFVSEGASFTTGAELVVDGGWSIW